MGLFCGSMRLLKREQKNPPVFRLRDLGPSGGTRTHDIQLPKRFSAFFIGVYSVLSSFLFKPAYFLLLLFPLFPCIPVLSVVLHVVSRSALAKPQSMGSHAVGEHCTF